MEQESAKVTALQSELDQERANLNVIKAELDQEKAVLDSLKANIEEQKAALEDELSKHSTTKRYIRMFSIDISFEQQSHRPTLSMYFKVIL